MANTVDITVPDIGDFHDVGVIEVFVKPGDAVAVDQPLITIETDKAAMDVPATVAGVIKELKVNVGSKVNQGDVIVVVEPSGAAPVEASSGSRPDRGQEAAPTTNAPAASPVGASSGSRYIGPVDIECQLAVIGSGPGGYTAAFRGADLGLKTVLVERWPVLGGVCTTVGCIPSKALLHAARVIEEAEAMHVHGLDFGKPKIDLGKLRGFKAGVVKKSNDGLAGLAKQRKVQVVNGTGKLLDAHHLVVEQDGKRTVVRFEHCILAAGSEPARIPGLPDDPRIIDSTGALELRQLPERMLVIGGGIIGLEMACVYDALGVKVSVVELTDTLVPGADRDVMRPLETRIKKRYEAVLLGTKVTKIEAEQQGIKVTFEGAAASKEAPAPQHYGLVLVAVGRRPLGKQLDADRAGVTVDERGFIPSDQHLRTNVRHIYSIGDLRGNPMLAHKATHEGKIAAENAAGHKRAFDARVIPSVAYTDPEVAWVGLTETEAKAAGIKLGKGVFPWAASGRARSIAREDGLTKLLFDETTHRLVGAATTGVNAGELIGELALAIEMGANAEDIGLTIHPHPTLSETVAMAAEVFDGTITDLYAPKKR